MRLTTEEDALEQNGAIILIPCTYPKEDVRRIVAVAKTEEKDFV